MSLKKPFFVRFAGMVELFLSIICIISILFLIISQFRVSILYLILSLFRGILFNGNFSWILVIIFGVVNLFSLITAITIIRFKHLGRRLMIILGSVFIFLNTTTLVYSFFIGNRIYSSLFGKFLGIPFFNYFNLFSILYYGALIYYFMTSEVKNAFQPN